MNLAFYGTLRDPDILRLVTGDDLLPCYSRSIAVQGWACLRIAGAAYPLLRSDPTASTVFHLYHDCSEVSWRRLLEYEGSEYSWIELAIGERSYRVFMADPCVAASEEIWDLESFQMRDKELYQKEMAAYFALSM